MWGTLGLVLGGLVLLGGALLEGIDGGSSSGSSAPPCGSRPKALLSSPAPLHSPTSHHPSLRSTPGAG